MKKLILVLLICSIVIAGVTADIIVSNLVGTTTMDKQLRDFLLTKVSTTLDAQGKPLPKEIKPTITIECADRICKYSAVQIGIISSYDNVMDRYYCTLYNKTTRECQTEVQYTIQEIETMVIDAVTSRLTNYANASIVQANPYIKVSEGTLTIGVKK